MSNRGYKHKVKAQHEPKKGTREQTPLNRVSGGDYAVLDTKLWEFDL